MDGAVSYAPVAQALRGTIVGPTTTATTVATLPKTEQVSERRVRARGLCIGDTVAGHQAAPHHAMSRKTAQRAERAKGIEPSPPAWKAGALPLSYARVQSR
jgi:hypothetical protein